MILEFIEQVQLFVAHLIYSILISRLIIISTKTTMSEEDDFYGDTAQAHQEFMGIVWGPIINIAIFLVMYSYRKWWGYLHALIGLFACIFSLACTLPILINIGIPSPNQELSTHFLVGIACMAVIALQTILGIISRVVNVFNASSIWIIRMKKIHAIFGYITIILCKADYVIVGETTLLIQDGIFIALIIIWKIFFPRMEKMGNNVDLTVKPRLIKSLSELDTSKDYVVFANYVYDTQELKLYHPAGYQIIAAVRNKEIDRYIYGMFAAQELPEIPMYSHSYKSLTLVGDPIAKIEITSVWGGFDQQEVNVSVSKMLIINEKERIYEMYLKKGGKQFSFNKYTSPCQIGRYHSITLNDTVTRLYTSVNFLVGENKKFMKKYLQGYQNQYGRIFKLTQCKLYHQIEQQIAQQSHIELQQVHTDNQIPILFKQYDNGKFTDEIIKYSISSLRISCVKGEGVQFESLSGGKIIMLVGGTGIYPLSDLIDMLYKSALAKQKPQLAQQIYTITPLLKSQPFAAFNFELIAAFNSLDDVHPITFNQLRFLTTNNQLKLTIKLRDNSSLRVKQIPNAILTKDSFEKILSQRGDLHDITKIWICGPPKMNENVSKYLRETANMKQKYLIL